VAIEISIEVSERVPMVNGVVPSRVGLSARTILLIAENPVPVIVADPGVTNGCGVIPVILAGVPAPLSILGVNHEPEDCSDDH
jgi:hypothetical protein